MRDLLTLYCQRIKDRADIEEPARKVYLVEHRLHRENLAGVWGICARMKSLAPPSKSGATVF